MAASARTRCARSGSRSPAAPVFRAPRPTDVSRWLKIGAKAIGNWELSASPRGWRQQGLPTGAGVNSFADLGLDASYQFQFDPSKVTGDMISAHATLIREHGDLAASQALLGSLANHELTTIRADVSYSFAATLTPSAQLFRTSGTTDPAYWGTPTGSPNSAGAIAEIAYVPFGKPNSPFQAWNVRFALQYVDYFQFNGDVNKANRNNALYASVWTALRF